MSVSSPEPPSREPVIEFRKVSKTFGAHRAVIDINLAIGQGEFFSLLGPSGCGKTTTLRLLAGFEAPDEDGGEVRIRGQVVNRLRPYERELSMVFQSYALFPHLSVERNIAFGLEQKKVPKAEIPDRVHRAMELVRLPPATFGGRPPSALSGGQRQRVALARALVVEPPILLLDEPLGALDLKLRKEMQYELKDLNRRLGITFVYVTHDQEEALTMSDRIAVMDNSRVAQLGRPAEIYEHPRTPFVAGFIGESNFLSGTVQAQDGAMFRVALGAGSFQVPAVGHASVGQAVKVALRPERVGLHPAEGGPGDRNCLGGRVDKIVYRGENLHVRVELDGGGTITAAARNEGQLRVPLRQQVGDRVCVSWDPLDGHVLEEDPR